MRHSRWILVCLAAFGPAVVLPPALASTENRGENTTDDAARSPHDLPSAVAALDSVSFSDRETAEEWLASRPEITLRNVFDVLTGQELSPEQRARLVRVAQLKFVTRDPAGLGVSFDMMARSEGVYIQSTVPGFAAAEFLKAQDEVRSVDGLTVWEADQVRAGILSHDPGESIEIGVMREGKPMVFKIRLGSFSGLETRRNSPEENVLEQAWDLRVAREFRRVHREDPALADRIRLAIVPDLAPERWLRVDAQIDWARRALASDQSRSGLNRPLQLPDVIAGGEPRGGVRHEFSERQMPFQGVRITTPQEIRRQERENLIVRLDHDIALLTQLRMTIAQNQAIIEAEDTPDATRAKLARQNVEAQDRLVELEKRIQEKREKLTDAE